MQQDLENTKILILEKTEAIYILKRENENLNQQLQAYEQKGTISSAAADQIALKHQLNSSDNNPISVLSLSYSSGPVECNPKRYGDHVSPVSDESFDEVNIQDDFVSVSYHKKSQSADTLYYINQVTQTL